MTVKIYRNVTLHLEPSVYEQIRKLAFKERTSIVSLTGEAICTYIKWLRVAEIKEAKEAELAKIETNQAEAETNLAEIEANLVEVAKALEEIKKKKRVKKRKRRKIGPRKSKKFPGERVYKRHAPFIDPYAEESMSDSMSDQTSGNSGIS